MNYILNYIFYIITLWEWKINAFLFFPEKIKVNFGADKHKKLTNPTTICVKFALWEASQQYNLDKIPFFRYSYAKRSSYENL